MSLMRAGLEGGGERVVEGHEQCHALVVGWLDESRRRCLLLLRARQSEPARLRRHGT